MNTEPQNTEPQNTEPQNSEVEAEAQVPNQPTTLLTQATTQTTLHDLNRIVLTDTKTTSEEKLQLLIELRRYNAASSDRWIFRSAIWTLCAVLVITLLGSFILAGFDIDIPDAAVTLGSTVAGSIAGLLSPQSSSSLSNSTPIPTQ